MRPSLLFAALRIPTPKGNITRSVYFQLYFHALSHCGIRDAAYSVFTLQFRLCQYVKDRFQTNALLVSGLGLTPLTLRLSCSLDSGE